MQKHLTPGPAVPLTMNFGSLFSFAPTHRYCMSTIFFFSYYLNPNIIGNENHAPRRPTCVISISTQAILQPSLKDHHHHHHINDNGHGPSPPVSSSSLWSLSSSSSSAAVAVALQPTWRVLWELMITLCLKKNGYSGSFKIEILRISISNHRIETFDMRCKIQYFLYFLEMNLIRGDIDS